MNKQKLDPKDSTYNSLKCEVDKEKRSEVKSENLKYNPCEELSSQEYVEWSIIWQNPAYVDVLSTPFMQYYGHYH
jgi:hypothetical protein